MSLTPNDEITRLIMNSALDAIVCIGTDGKISFWSKQSEKMFGWKEEEVKGKLLSETIIPERHRKKHNEGVKRYAQFRETTVLNRVMEIEAVNNEGREFPVELTIVPVKQNGEEFFCGFIRDISERKNAEEQLTKEKELSDSVIDSLPGIFYLQSEEGKYIRWNKNFEKASGYTSEEIRMLDPLSFFSGEDRERIKAAIKKVFSEGKTEVIANAITKDKRIIPFYFKAKCITYQGKRCMIGTGIDLSQQQTAQHEIKKSEEKYRSLFEQASDAIMVTDFTGNFLDVNDSLCKMFGYSKSELMQMNISSLIDTENMKTQPINFNLLAAGAHVFNKRKMLHKDGHIIEVEANVKKISDTSVLAIARDITEQLKAADAIKQSEERYRALVENAPEALVVFDVEREKFESVSESAVDFFKMSKAELLEIGPIDVSPEFQPDGKLSSEKAREKITEAIAGGKPSFEWMHCDKLGNEIPCEIWLVRLPSESKILVRGSIINITERKKTEETIRLSEQKYKLLFNKNPLPMLMLSKPELSFIDVNDAAVAQYGYSREEFLRMNAFEIRPAEEIKPFTKMIDNSTEGINNFGIWRHKKKDGTIIKVEVMAHHIINNGKPAWLVLAHDITERLLAEDKLKESEFQFRKVTENEILGVAWATPQGRVKNANNTFYTMLGYTAEELNGMHFAEFTHPEDTLKELTLVEQIVKGNLDYYQVEKRYKTKQGEYLWVELNLSTYRNPSDNSIEFFIGIVQNIHERKMAEEEIKRSHEELRQLSSYLETIREEERTNIAREIHDELGQQLTGLKMDASWLNKKIPADNKNVLQKIAGMISLIDDTVKTVRRISTELRPGILDDLGLVDALQWQSTEFEKRTGIACKFNTTFNESSFEKKLSTGIFRVFQETLTNVARHANASEIKTSLEREDENVILKVHDNGSGFEEKEIKSKKTLGLVGMKERAKMFGGSLTVQSAAGKGTVIILQVPLRIASPEIDLVK